MPVLHIFKSENEKFFIVHHVYNECISILLTIMVEYDFRVFSLIKCSYALKWVMPSLYSIYLLSCCYDLAGYAILRIWKTSSFDIETFMEDGKLFYPIHLMAFWEVKIKSYCCIYIWRFYELSNIYTNKSVTTSIAYGILLAVH